MTAHEAPDAVYDHIAADYTRERAADLVRAYDAHHHAVMLGGTGSGYMDRADWLAWEGRAYSLLTEVARG